MDQKGRKSMHGYILTYSRLERDICQLWVLNRGDLISASAVPHCGMG